MGFDIKKFQKAEFAHREEKVNMDALKDFFDDKPEFTVRGLTGEEMARVNEAQSKQKNLSAIVDALAANADTEKIKGLREAVGLTDDDVPGDLARRIEMLRLGCVDPELDERDAVKVFKVAPVDAYGATNTILQLSGQGMRPGESKSSGKKKASKQHSTSATPEDGCSTN